MLPNKNINWFVWVCTNCSARCSFCLLVWLTLEKVVNSTSSYRFMLKRGLSEIIAFFREPFFVVVVILVLFDGLWCGRNGADALCRSKNGWTLAYLYSPNVFNEINFFRLISCLYCFVDVTENIISLNQCYNLCSAKVFTKPQFRSYYVPHKIHNKLNQFHCGQSWLCIFFSFSLQTLITNIFKQTIFQFIWMKVNEMILNEIFYFGCQIWSCLLVIHQSGNCRNTEIFGF